MAAQGDIVRQLKSSKADKKVIDEAVAKLKELKKHLAAVSSKPVPTVVPPKPVSEEGTPQPVAIDAAQLEKDVAAQGDVVRQLKSGKADKKVIEEAVAKLLELKKQLAAAATLAPPKPASKESTPQLLPASKESSPQLPPVATAQLEKDVAAQGDIVRQLKSSKSEKKAVDEAVAKLLDLKKQLAAATGHEQPAANAHNSKKKGGNKKKH